MSHPYQNQAFVRPAAELAVGARARFIMRTYAHLVGAIMAFTAIEVFLFSSGMALTIARAMTGVSWLLVLGGFMVAGMIFSRMAYAGGSKASQYVGLGAYVLIEAVIFVPILLIANMKAPGVIQSAALTTVLGFSGLTAVVFVTRKDFSFMRSILMWAGIVALVMIAASALFGFQLGTLFSVAMVALSGGYVLYQTSNVLHHFPENAYVGASLALFASIATMFWYVLRIFMSSRD